jgi:hypothetical protein
MRPGKLVVSSRVRLSSQNSQIGWHVLKVGLLAAMTVLTTWAGIRGSLFSGAAAATPEPMILAIFGAALISLGLLLRRRISQNGFVPPNHNRGES